MQRCKRSENNNTGAYIIKGKNEQKEKQNAKPYRRKDNDKPHELTRFDHDRKQKFRQC